MTRQSFAFVFLAGMTGCNVDRPLQVGEPSDGRMLDAGSDFGSIVSRNDLAETVDLATMPYRPDMSSVVEDLAQPPQPEDMSLPQPSSAPCLSGGNVIYLNGSASDYVHPGVETLYGGTWTSSSSSPMTIAYSWNNDIPVFWEFDFSSRNLGTVLDLGHYDSAERYPFEDAGHPGMTIAGHGRGCDNDHGWFEIESLARTPAGDYSEFTIIFEQYCDYSQGPLFGCIHFESP